MKSFREALLKLNDEQMGWLFIAPAMLVLLVFIVWPIINIVFYSFQQKTIYLPEAKFIGLLNFKMILSDPRFWYSLWITLFFTVIAVSLEFILGMIIALALNAEFKGRRYVRAIALIPWALPTAVMAMGWKWIYNDDYGILASILKHPGNLLNIIPLKITHVLADKINAWLQPYTAKISLLSSPTGAMACMIFADVWKTTPFIVILLLAGLQSIPKDLYEAMDIDGATAREKFLYVTLPLLRPAIGLALMFRAMYTLGIFDLPWVLTGGGPANSTRTIAMYLYDNFFRYMDLGYGSAITVITSFVIFGVGLLVAIIGRTKWTER